MRPWPGTSPETSNTSMTTPHTPGRLTFRENGDTNSYALLDDTGNWLMSLLHNGQQLTDTQRENLRRLVVCWNACEGIPTANLQKHEADPATIFALLMETAAQRHEYADQIAWLQDVSTLHRSVDILYVVDGYEVTVVWDGEPISDSFHGETVSEAISKAMAEFDLNARHPRQDRGIHGHERQMAAAVAAEREACAKVCEAMAAEYKERASKPEDQRDINPGTARIAGMVCSSNASAIRARGHS